MEPKRQKSPSTSCTPKTIPNPKTVVTTEVTYHKENHCDSSSSQIPINLTDIPSGNPGAESQRNLGRVCLDEVAMSSESEDNLGNEPGNPI